MFLHFLIRSLRDLLIFTTTTTEIALIVVGRIESLQSYMMFRYKLTRYINYDFIVTVFQHTINLLNEIYLIAKKKHGDEYLSSKGIRKRNLICLPSYCFNSQTVVDLASTMTSDLSIL